MSGAAQFCLKTVIVYIRSRELGVYTYVSNWSSGHTSILYTPPNKGNKEEGFSYIWGGIIRTRMMTEWPDHCQRASVSIPSFRQHTRRAKFDGKRGGMGVGG